jgi:hypothetical protein
MRDDTVTGIAAIIGITLTICTLLISCNLYYAFSAHLETLKSRDMAIVELRREVYEYRKELGNE